MNKILDTIKKVSSDNNIKIDFKNINVTLKDLNIDSLSAMNLIMLIEEELKITLDDDILLNIKTLNDLINAFEKSK